MYREKTEYKKPLEFFITAQKKKRSHVGLDVRTDH